MAAMLTLVINPGGRPRVVSIAEALYHFGVDISRPNHCPERTPEERERHRREKAVAYRSRKVKQERGPE